jgi:hypothetical protein
MGFEDNLLKSAWCGREMIWRKNMGICKDLETQGTEGKGAGRDVRCLQGCNFTWGTEAEYHQQSPLEHLRIHEMTLFSRRLAVREHTGASTAYTAQGWFPSWRHNTTPVRKAAAAVILDISMALACSFPTSMWVCRNVTCYSRGQRREKSVVGSSGGCESIMMSGK